MQIKKAEPEHFFFLVLFMKNPNAYYTVSLELKKKNYS